MRNDSIIGVVVVYNPNIEKLIDNVNCYIQNIDKLLLWQNSSITNEDKKKIIDECSCSEKIVFSGNGSNRGLDVAFNEALEVASKEKYIYLMTMDQDSTWLEFDKYLSTIASVKNDRIAIFGPQVINAFDVVDYKHKECSIETADFVISSGAIYKVNIISLIGGFSEGYFIDAVDEEICFRAKKRGFETVRVNTAKLLQEFGTYKKRSVFGRTIASSNYSAFRYYYIVRNHIWLAKSGLLDKQQRRLTLRNYVFSLSVKVLLLEENKVRKIISIIKGIGAGFFSKPKERIIR